MTTEHFDVLIVGAGLSGIGAAYHLRRDCPDRSYAILEGRGAIGGTWDLFRYPGIRSDSDMYTLGYAFKPWREAKAIADGPSILKYVRETARDHDIERHIRFNHRVTAAAWSSEAALWTVQATKADGSVATLTCNFLLMASGYYRYSAGYTPDFPGLADYKGTFIHPQHWPEGLDYTGKNVVVIGSGATAVTIVPEMAKTAGHVVMLQRSPTYMVSRPAEDAIANWLRARLPAMLAYNIIRWRNVLFQLFFFSQARKNPAKAKENLIGLVRQMMGPDYDVDTHFTPKYNPWDQRLCLVPDADMFEALKSGKAEIVTDHIDHLTAGGIALKSGKTLPADIIVSATGLKLVVAGEAAITVDGRPIRWADTMSYKGLMYSGVPNFGGIFGYTNASWTLKADLASEFVCRLLNAMKARKVDYCVPQQPDASVAALPWLDFSSGYVQRAMSEFPRQGDKKPWQLYQNYIKDMLTLRHARLDDGVLKFAKKGAAISAPANEAEARPLVHAAE
jgi:cation diffusion facilitator CzcD-associated flavoprotein CzcO